MPRRVSSPIFVGRVAERVALSTALDRAADGQPGVVLIAGEAGVGKSRLAAEAASTARASGFSVAVGACIDVAAGTLAYAPFVDIVQDLHRAGLAASLPAGTRAELGRLVPEATPDADRHRGAGEAGAGGQGRLFAAVRDLLAVASSSAPLLVTIEDLHWADGSTLDLVTYLARSMQTDRCLVIATARLDTLPRRHPLLGVVAELARLPWLEWIDLGRFDEGELVQQLTGILGRPPDPVTAHEVFGRSDGNAFFAEELVAARTVRGGAMPTSLREVLAARFETLGEETRNVVRIASVAGRVVDHDLLERVAPVPPSVLIAALREAVEQRVLLQVERPTPGYAFRHALLREAAYDELLPAERIAIHRGIADALELDEAASPAGELGRTGEIAFHALAANDHVRALRASLAAVAVAEQASAHAEVELQLDRIREIWPRIPDAAARVGMDHPALLLRGARAAASAGHQARAVELAAQALGELDTEDADRRVATLLDLFDYAWEAADVETASRVLDDVMSLVRPERSARSAQAFSGLALLEWHHGRYTKAREAAVQAISIARDADAPAKLARALSILAQVDTHLGETSHADTSFAEAAAMLEGIDDPDTLARSTRWWAWARNMHGRYADALALNRRGFDVACRDGSDARYGVDLLDGALENLVELGRWAEAQDVAEQIRARMTISLEMLGFHGSLARMYALQGRAEDAERESVLAAAYPAAGPYRVWQLEDAIFLAYMSGRHADGRRLMDAALAASPEPDREAVLWWPLLKAIGGEADRADAARRRRREAEVHDAVAAGRRFATILLGSVTAAIEADGAGPMACAVLHGADAEHARLEGHAEPARWAAAAEARVETEQPWELAYARFRQGEAVLAAGRGASDAAPLLREAHALAVSLDAAPLRASIERLAGRARIQLERQEPAVSPAAPRAAPPLTSREREVLALVAAGHTNREIGDRLFISEKTASVHVTHAMDKLGALSRYEAAAAATRLGLLEPDAVP